MNINAEIIKITEEIRWLYILLDDKKITEEEHKNQVYTKLSEIKFLAENNTNT